MSHKNSHQFEKIRGVTSKIGLREIFNDNSFLFEHIRSENYPVFESEIINKNSRILLLKSRSQSQGQMHSNSRSIILNSSKQKKLFNFKEKSDDQCFKSRIFRHHSSSQIINHSFNKIITRACLLRNEKKKSKNFYCRNANPNLLIFANEKPKSGLLAQPKLILPRKSSGQVLQPKQKQTDFHTRVLYKIKRKKKLDFPRSNSIVPSQYQFPDRGINAWDFEQQHQLQF